MPIENNNYPGRIDPALASWKNSPWTELLKERYRIAALFCQDKNVLDSGCGTGWGTMNYIVPVAGFVAGFDLDGGAQKKFSRGPNFRFFQADAADNLALPEAPFARALALDTIEHFDEDKARAYLANLNAALLPDGVLIGTTPLVIHGALAPLFLKDNRYHRKMFTRPLLCEFLEARFAEVAIFEVYSPISPYFLFFCGKSSLPRQEISGKVSGFFLGKEAGLRRSRQRHLLRWARQLVRLGKFREAFGLVCSAGHSRR